MSLVPNYEQLCSWIFEQQFESSDNLDKKARNPMLLYCENEIDNGTLLQVAMFEEANGSGPMEMLNCVLTNSECFKIHNVINIVWSVENENRSFYVRVFVIPR